MTTQRPPIGFVRDAGPAAMAGKVTEWDEVDESSDASFPASDPPSFSPRKNPAAEPGGDSSIQISKGKPR